MTLGFSENPLPPLDLINPATRNMDNNISAQRVRRLSFDANQIAQILMAIVAINGWNRIAIATQMIPGTYQVQKST